MGATTVLDLPPGIGDDLPAGQGMIGQLLTGLGFLLRPKGGGATRRFALGHGDLLVMGGSCQRTWEHSVPKTSASTGPRVSIQFRPRDVR